MQIPTFDLHSHIPHTLSLSISDLADGNCRFKLVN
jgi:hypothetical protein